MTRTKTRGEWRIVDGRRIWWVTILPQDDES
jgi:hypothetical protein